MKENGVIITWKAWESIFGTMDECMKENIRMIKNTGSVFMYGQIDAHTKATGTKESSMPLEYTPYPRTRKSNLGFGKMASANSGSTRTKYI